MNTREQRIREFAYQIWESEGKPHGQTERHWHMASKLADTHAAIAQEYAGSTEPAPSVEPITPISPSQPAQPVSPSDPIQPTDPVLPGQQSAAADETATDKPVKAKRLRTKAAEKTAEPETAKASKPKAAKAAKAEAAAEPKKTGRLRKAKNPENELA